MHNKQRRSDVMQILNAIYQYALDNNGKLPTSITTIPMEICTITGSNCSGMIDLGVLTRNNNYLIKIPKSPQADKVNGTGYLVSKVTNSKVLVSSLLTEGDEVTSVFR